MASRERGSAKVAAREAQGTVPSPWAARSSTVSRLRAAITEKAPFPPRIGKAIKELDHALPGPHTRLIYDNLDKDDAKVIAQLRSGDAKLN